MTSFPKFLPSLNTSYFQVPNSVGSVPLPLPPPSFQVRDPATCQLSLLTCQHWRDQWTRASLDSCSWCWCQRRTSWSRLCLSPSSLCTLVSLTLCASNFPTPTAFYMLRFHCAFNVFSLWHVVCNCGERFQNLCEESAHSHRVKFFMCFLCTVKKICSHSNENILVVDAWLWGKLHRKVHTVNSLVHTYYS